MVSFFTKSIISIFDHLVPLTYRRVTNKSPKWLNNAIHKIIALKNRALSKYNGTGSANDWLRYKKLRNMTSSAIRQEKRAFLNSSTTDRPSYDFWRNLTLLGGHNNSSPTIPSHLLDAHSLNNFFINSLPSSPCSSSLKNFFLVSAPIIQNNFQFSPINMTDLYNILKSIKLTSSGPYDFSGRMLLFSTPTCLDPLLFILNSCLTKGTFPSAWKHSTVLPLPKVSNPSSFTSLRPISLPPFLSKILERIIFTQLNHFLCNNKIIHDFQSGFRKHFSTTTSLLHLSDSVLRAFDNHSLSALVALDFSKAFDTVNHDLLLAKLRYYNLSNLAISLLRSFLLNRSQSVLVRNPLPLLSSALTIPSGVPQGSILGPLLFNIFVADLPSLPTASRLYMYADDVLALISFTIPEAQQAAKSLNNDLGLISDWSKANGLHLNPTKSSILVTGFPSLLSRLHSFDIHIQHTSLEPRPSIRILGLYVDSSWSFEHHVTMKCRLAYSRLKMLFPLRHILSVPQKLLVTQSLIVSLFDYADVVYIPCLNKRLLHRIQLIQNSCLRLSYGIRKYDHISPSYQRSGWLNIYQRFIVHLCCTIYKTLHSNTPLYLRDLLHLNIESHSGMSIDTRHQNLLSCPSHHTKKFQNAFSYSSAKFYNSLPPHIRAETSLSSFKSKLTQFIFEHYK